MDTLAQMHENILAFLLDKRKTDPNLFFSLRTTNRYDRLEKGYWFLGANVVIISFWEGKDWKTKTPNIFFEIWENNQTSLRFAAKSSEKNAAFFNKVTKIISGFIQEKTKKGDKVNFWYKNYENKNDYIKSLDAFIEGDKKRIDDLLKLEHEYTENFEIKFLNEVKQNEYFKNIEKYRGKTQNKKDEKKELELIKLELINIGHFENIEIDLSKKITCLLGENGTGKSTILRAIALGLAGTDHDENNFDISKIESLLKITETQNAKPTYEKRGSIKIDYKTDKKHENNITFSYNSYTDNVRIEDLIIEANKFESVIDTSIFRIPIIGFSQVQEEKIETTKLRLINKPKEPNLSDIIHLISNIPDNKFSTVKNWLFDVSFSGEQELLEKFYNIINKITNENIKITIGKKGDKKLVAITTSGAKEGVPLELVSQGLNNVIIWIGFLIKRLYELTPPEKDFRQTKAIVLIDEIDTHLHPKWQKNILNILSETFANIHFIITTHSPLLVINLKNENKKVYNITKDKVIDLNYTYGSNINTFLYDYMQIKERPEEIENKIDNLFDIMEEFDNNNIDEVFEKYKELYNLLGSNDEYIIQTKTLFELRDIEIIYDDNNAISYQKIN